MVDPYFEGNCKMPNEGCWLCSDIMLLRVSTGSTTVGNLESIWRRGCEVKVEELIRGSSQVTMERLALPARRRSNARRLEGEIVSQSESSDYGVVVRIEFTNGEWSRNRWRPQHLWRIPANASAKPAKAMAGGAAPVC